MRSDKDKGFVNTSSPTTDNGAINYVLKEKEDVGLIFKIDST